MSIRPGVPLSCWITTVWHSEGWGRCLESTPSAMLNGNVFFFHVAVIFNILKNPVCGLWGSFFGFFYSTPGDRDCLEKKWECSHC